MKHCARKMNFRWPSGKASPPPMTWRKPCPIGNYTKHSTLLSVARGGYTILWLLGFVLSWVYVGVFAYMFLRKLLRADMTLPAQWQAMLLPCLLAAAAQLYLLTLALVAVYEARYIQPLYPIMILLVLTAPFIYRRACFKKKSS